MASVLIDAAFFCGAALNFFVEPCRVTNASKWPGVVSMVVTMPSFLYTAVVTAAQMAFRRVVQRGDWYLYHR